MYSLSELVFTSDDKYLKYFSKKTGYLLPDVRSAIKSNVRFIWNHLVRTYRFAEQFAALKEPEKETFYHLLNNFGYLPPEKTEGGVIEEKISWVFRHPTGGVFVPVEIFKLLMQEEALTERSYLFQLLYRLKTVELRNYASLLGSTIEGQVNISFEKNPLDMALVIYIWLSGKIRDIQNVRDVIPERGRVLSAPFGKTAGAQQKGQQKSKEIGGLLPSAPVPMWGYLKTHFAHLQDDVDKLYTLISKGNKGFYRSVTLLRHPESDLIEAFRNGILIPMIPQKKKRSLSVDNYRIVSPAEFIFHQSLFD